MKIILQGGRVLGDVSVIIAEDRKHPHQMISLFIEEKVPNEFSDFMFSEHSFYLFILLPLLIENSVGINILIFGAFLILTFQNYSSHLRLLFKESLRIITGFSRSSMRIWDSIKSYRALTH